MNGSTTAFALIGALALAVPAAAAIDNPGPLVDADYRLRHPCGLPRGASPSRRAIGRGA
jgi:hypothetical protein